MRVLLSNIKFKVIRGSSDRKKRWVSYLHLSENIHSQFYKTGNNMMAYTLPLIYSLSSFLTVWKQPLQWSQVVLILNIRLAQAYGCHPSKHCMWLKKQWKFFITFFFLLKAVFNPEVFFIFFLKWLMLFFFLLNKLYINSFHISSSFPFSLLLPLEYHFYTFLWSTWKRKYLFFQNYNKSYLQ